jgi:hypothetical protein
VLIERGATYSILLVPAEQLHLLTILVRHGKQEEEEER